MVEQENNSGRLAGAVSANLNVRQLLAASDRDLAMEKKGRKRWPKKN
jgi:hypothetical protein